MKKTIKKSGQKIIKKFSRVSKRASVESKEHIKENVFARISHILNIKLLIFEWALLVVALIMLAATQAFWFGDSYAENVFVEGGTYTEATIGKINSMNPLFATTNSEKALSKLMFAELVSNDFSGHPGLELAKSLNSSENGKVWKLKLKDGLKWSDGEPITIDDVMYTIEIVQNPAVSSSYGANLSGVKVSKGEEDEVVFTLPSAYADFITVLDIPIVPKHELEDSSPKALIEDDFSVKPVTSGPFVLNATQDSYDESETTVFLSPNPNYYKKGPMLTSFAIHTYETKDALVSAMKAGTITATAELSGAEASDIISSQFIKKESGINWGTFVFFNTTNGIFKNLDLRSSVRKGVDVNAVRASAPNTIAIDYPIIDSQIALNNKPALPDYDFEGSASKIAEISGENKLAVNLVTVQYGYLPEVANTFAEQLQNLGFEVNLAIYDENQEFISNIVSKRNYDIMIYDIELGTDPDPLPYYHSSQASSNGLNLSGYRNAIVDDLLISARSTEDKELRTKKYESFLNYWTNDIPSIGLYQANLTYIYNKNVRTFGDNIRLVEPLDRFMDVTDWAVNKGIKNKTP